MEDAQYIKFCTVDCHAVYILCPLLLVPKDVLNKGLNLFIFRSMNCYNPRQVLYK